MSTFKNETATDMPSALLEHPNWALAEGFIKEWQQADVGSHCSLMHCFKVVGVYFTACKQPMEHDSGIGLCIKECE